jgi:hypothetical protein
VRSRNQKSEIIRGSSLWLPSAFDLPPSGFFRLRRFNARIFKIGKRIDGLARPFEF